MRNLCVSKTFGDVCGACKTCRRLLTLCSRQIAQCFFVQKKVIANPEGFTPGCMCISRFRTPDNLVRSQALYPLSYGSRLRMCGELFKAFYEHFSCAFGINRAPCLFHDLADEKVQCFLFAAFVVCCCFLVGFDYFAYYLFYVECGVYC